MDYSFETVSKKLSEGFGRAILQRDGAECVGRGGRAPFDKFMKKGAGVFIRICRSNEENMLSSCQGCSGGSDTKLGVYNPNTSG